VLDMPYLTADLAGVGGRLKVQDSDFRVVEIPLYTPIGHGEHTYLRIEKRGIPTFEAVRRVARALRIDPRSVGYAGLKDAHAISEQTISVGNVTPSMAERLDVPGVRVLSADRHTNKLRVGHLAGNRFIVRIRDVVHAPPTGGEIQDPVSVAGAILDVLARQGVPNYYGEQRFGLRGDTHLLGRALVRQDVEAFVHRLVGLPDEMVGTAAGAESPAVHKARVLFEEGDLAGSLRLLPRHMQAERRAVQTLLERPGEHHRALRAIPNKMRRFYVSAYQSALFNQVVAQRLTGRGSEDANCVSRQPVGKDNGGPGARQGSGLEAVAMRRGLGDLMYGDLAYIHTKGAVFLVKDPAREQARADRLEISPSGPLFGYKVTLAEGEPGKVERQLLAEEGLELEDFRLRGLKLKGARRPLRFPLGDVSAEMDDQGLVVSFVLPPGCYATVVLREIMKAG
jgi:tRNA pseudouridine13 synthase